MLSATTCAIGGEVTGRGSPLRGWVLTTTTGGARWTEHPTTPTDVYNVSCAPQLCMAITYDGYVAAGSP